jgi:hypothetical protein
MVNLYDSTHFDSLLKSDNTKLVGSIPHTSLDQRFCELFFLLQKCLKNHVIILQLQSLGYNSLSFIVLQLQKLNYNSQNLPLFDNCKN